jgi:2-iminobutanoate/2-iminopropanoate deaminase
MKKKLISHGNAQAVGPYSPALLVDDRLYISGQIAMDPSDGSLIEGDVQTQCHRIMQNIAFLLREAGMGISDLVQCRIYLADMNDFPAVNAVYQSYLSEPYPVRATVEVSRLPKDVSLEIEALAVRG